MSKVSIHSEAHFGVQAAGPMSAPGAAERRSPQSARGLHSPVSEHRH